MQDSSAIHLPEPGTVIDGRYRIGTLLERGSMGVVFEALHVHLDEPVALKFLSRPDGAETSFRSRFLREAKVTAQLRGRNIVRTTDFGVDDSGRPFLVMEMLQGESLRAVLKKSGAMPIAVAVDYAVQVCTGLAEAHRRGVVHRDLKPANLFITTDVDGSDLVKIVDFGLSKLRFTNEDLTGEGTLLGSPRYMAPEQVTGAESTDERADIWSLGAVLYEMLAGAPPFRASSPAKLVLQVAAATDIVPLDVERPEVAPALRDVIMGCLARDPTRRIDNVGTLAMRLAQAVPDAGLEDAARQVVDILYKAEQRVKQSPAGRGEGSTGDTSRGALPQRRENRASVQFRTWAGLTLALSACVALVVWWLLRDAKPEHAPEQPPPIQPPVSLVSALPDPAASLPAMVSASASAELPPASVPRRPQPVRTTDPFESRH